MVVLVVVLVVVVVVVAVVVAAAARETGFRIQSRSTIAGAVRIEARHIDTFGRFALPALPLSQGRHMRLALPYLS